AGAHVILGARTREHLETEVEILTSSGRLASAFELDVSSRESCHEFARRAHQTAGPPDILVNNAGMGIFRPVHLFQDEEFERQFRVNVFGTYYMTREAVPFMRENGSGHIVNISSLAGESSARMGTGYFAAKHAIHGFTRSLMEELRDWGIKVTLVCPGSVDTRFHFDSHPGSHEKDQSWMLMPEDIAASVLHVLTLPESALVSKIDVRPAKVPHQ
ncbi:SDR family oxidoreductase, partial [Candidatus Poribacteria bacterium]|nr:SDR family oxidoreductase [Candidatus Poribacteria bacterium]